MTKEYLPNSWHFHQISDVAEVQTGIAKGGKKYLNPVLKPYLRVANVQFGYLDLKEIKMIQVESTDIKRYTLQYGDVLLTEGGDADKLGRGTVWRDEVVGCLHQNHVFAVRPNITKILPEYLALLTQSTIGRKYFELASKQTTNLASINSTQLKNFKFPLPPIWEQRAILNYINKLEIVLSLQQKLISAKRSLKQGLMQQLLTGKRRFPEFDKSQQRQDAPIGSIPKDWQLIKIGEIAKEISQKGAPEGITVLSCTKHNGLVASLEYFGRQIFSQNLNTYKVVKHNQFAYATNHIEEGSIGLLRDLDVGLVSPMYTVFETSDKVEKEFLFALLKTESYRRIFESLTSASVDRRGSLRWNVFSKILIGLPSLLEQQKIIFILHKLDQEISILEKQLNLIRLQKRGLMQKLLTGEIRIPIFEENEP